MKLQIRTAVKASALEKCCEEMPECTEFLRNFFETCKPYHLDTNWANYLMDLEQQREVNPGWNKYYPKLVHAFKEIAYLSEVLN